MRRTGAEAGSMDTIQNPPELPRRLAAVENPPPDIHSFAVRQLKDKAFLAARADCAVWPDCNCVTKWKRMRQSEL